MSVLLAKKLGIFDKIDFTQSTIMQGVGTSVQIGRVHNQTVTIGSLTFTIDIDVTIASGFDWLLGMDMFEPLKSVIDFEHHTASFTNGSGSKTTVPLVKQQDVLSH
jgi:hypothetical protein